MEERIEKEKLDVEWVELMKLAKHTGLTISEVRNFLKDGTEWKP